MPNWKQVLGHHFDEAHWAKAKSRAEEEGHSKDWPYVVGIYKRMTRSGEFETAFSKVRKKTKASVDAWKEKHPRWKGSARKLARKKYGDPSKFEKVAKAIHRLVFWVR